MPIDDFFRALPFVLLVGAVPGVALTWLIAPRLSWPERLVAAPGFSVGFVGVAGLILRQLGFPFALTTMIPVLVVLIVAGAVMGYRSRRQPPVDGVGPGWAVTGVALVAGAVVIGIVIAATHTDSLPPGNDPALHGAVAATIVRASDVLPVVPVPADGSGFVRTQAAFEATDALASELGAGNPAQVMLPLALISLLALPLGIAVLAHRVTGDRRVAAVAALLSVGLIFPTWPVGYGDYPYLVDSTLVVPLVLAVARCLEGTSVARSAALAGAAVLAIWVIHGLEIPTAVAVGGFLWLSILTQRRRAALRGLAVAAATCLIGVGVGYVLTRAPALPVAHPSGPSGPAEASAYLAQERGVGLGALQPFVSLDLTILSGALLAAGAVMVVIRRRGRWLLGSVVIPLLCVADVTGQQWLHGLWLRLYPWTDLDRLIGLEYFIVPVIAGIGAVGLVELWAHRGARVGPERRDARPALSAAVLIAAGAGGLVLGAPQTSAMLSVEMGQAAPVPAQDVSVIQELAAHLPRGSLILNDGVADSGQWITALTQDVEVEPRGYANEYLSDWRIVALGQACSDPSAAQGALHGVQAAFVGSDPAVGSSHLWNAGCLDSLPGLRLVAGSTSGAAGFLVTDRP